MKKERSFVIGRIDDLSRRAVINPADRNVDDPAIGAFVEVADGRGSSMCLHRRMGQRRPLVLLAVDPPLLASLLRDALAGDDLEVVVADRSAAAADRCDVAVVTDRLASPHSSHVVCVGGHDDFATLVTTVRRLCEVSRGR